MDKTEKTADEIRLEAEQSIKNLATETTKAEFEKRMKDITSKYDEQLEKGATKEDLEKANKSMKSEMDKFSSEIKKMGQISREEKKDKSIADSISEALENGAETLKNLSGKQSLALKAVTAASWTDAATLARQTTDSRTSLYNSPYSPLYLRNIFPNVSTDSSAIVIPQRGVITGGVAEWARGSGTGGVDVAKPDVSPAYKDVNVPIKWLAGMTTVNRELLLNVKYLQGSITNTLLYSNKGLFAAENKYISDYLATNAVAYSGSKTVGAEMIVDAAFNQLLGSYFNPTHVLMNQADYLTYVKFNKAVGSGEYDLPNDMLRGFAGSGLEANVQIVPVPSLPAGTAYVISAPEFEFINRLSPELKVSEEHDENFAYNKVTFRIEEMIGFVAKDLNAMVKVTLEDKTPAE